MVEKKRRITKKDLEEVAEYIREEKKCRASSTYRQDHERIWREVDRQIAMKPEDYVVHDPAEQWESNIELGSLADASEIIADDVMRIAFPSDRDWFKPHVNIVSELEIDPETGNAILDSDRQALRDNVYKSLISQQHSDFGLRHRVKLSVKEALHHGSFVAVVDWRTQKQFYGAGIKEIGSPVWIPHSMWNCYPDDSPSVVGTNVTYDGSMIIEEDVPLSVVLQQRWMNLDKVREKAGKSQKSVKLLTYYGDIFIKRASDNGIFIPNQKVIVYEDWVLHTEENQTPSSPIIYSGYERDDVRDPYYSSPLIKRSPTHKLATHCANKYVEAVDLRTFPPIGYDANEPAFREDGGPTIAPKASFPLRSGGQMKTIDVADPTWALQGLQLFKGEVEEGVGVDSVRKGASAAVEQTAFEISKLDQKSEIRTIDFVNTLEVQGLKPFLYLQHELNKKLLGPYGFYNSQLRTPDFVTASKEDINKWAKECHFEVTGSKGVLGEERRRQGSLEITGFFASTPGFAERLNHEVIMADAYRDVGQKDPERYIKGEEEGNPEAQAVKQEAEQVIAQIQEELAKVQAEVQKIPLMQEQSKAEKAKLVAEKAVLAAENKLLEEQIQLQNKKDSAEKQLLAIREKIMNEIRSESEKAATERQRMLETSEKQSKESAKEVQGKAENIESLLEQERQLVGEMLQFLGEERETRKSRDEKVKQFILSNGTDEAKEFISGL